MTPLCKDPMFVSLRQSGDLGPLADWLQDHDHHVVAEAYRLNVIDRRLEDWNWLEVFKYATPGTARKDDCPTYAFDRVDVKRIAGIQDGDNDGPDWVCYGELWDGRWFGIRAGCDYTGWG